MNWRISSHQQGQIMKLLIACDMEGISGVTGWDQVDPGKAEYLRFRHLMTGDVNAAITGALAAGVNEILVSDGHWNSGNVLLEELDKHASLFTGTPSPLSMVQGANEGIDAAFFIGYHARIGSENAILDHTWSSVRVSNLWINGRLSGEFGLNGAVVGAFGAPVILVSGDQTVASEATEWAPGVECVQVKKSYGRFEALCLPLETSRRLIQQGSERAVKNFLQGKAPKPIQVEKPVRITIEFMYSHMADMACLLPDSTRLDGRRIEFSAVDMPQAYRSFRAAVSLASA
jgi:D-amino peptidase